MLRVGITKHAYQQAWRGQQHGAHRPEDEQLSDPSRAQCRGGRSPVRSTRPDLDNHGVDRIISTP